MFSYESPRRGETLVTRKITRAVAAIKAEKALDWKAKTHRKELAALMVDADIKAALSPLGY